MLKSGLYLLGGLTFIFAFWFYPKYTMIKQNPGVCVKLVGSIYYCGDASEIDKLLEKNDLSKKLIIPK